MEVFPTVIGQQWPRVSTEVTSMMQVAHIPEGSRYEERLTQANQSSNSKSSLSNQCFLYISKTLVKHSSQLATPVDDNNRSIYSFVYCDTNDP